MVYLGTKGERMRNSVVEGTGYNPRRWKERSEAMAAWSSFPGRPAAAVGRRSEFLSRQLGGDKLTYPEVLEDNLPDLVDGERGLIRVVVSDGRLERRFVTSEVIPGLYSNGKLSNNI